jgi:hypothetical protein
MSRTAESKRAKRAGDALWKHVDLAASYLRLDDRRALMGVSHEGYRVVCERMTHEVRVCAKHSDTTRSMRHLRGALVRYTALSRVTVTYERCVSNTGAQRERFKAVKAVATEVDEILQRVELAAALKQQASPHDGRRSTLTVRFRPPRMPSGVPAAERVRGQMFPRSAWLDLARSTVRALDLSLNGLFEDGAELARALRTNRWLTTLNLSWNRIGESERSGGAASVALAEAVGTMRALVRLNVSHNALFRGTNGHPAATTATAWANALRAAEALRELDLAANHLGATCTQMVAAAIRDHRELAVVNVLLNPCIGDDDGGLRALASAWGARRGLRSLCGAGAGSALVLSRRNLSAADVNLSATDAKLIALELRMMHSALTKCDLRNNWLGAAGAKSVAEALRGNAVMQELNVSNNHLGKNSNVERDVAGVRAFAKVLPTMAALRSLSLARNWIDAEGAQHLAAALPRCK